MLRLTRLLGGVARSTRMTRRILDRQKLKHAVEDSKRVLEAARGRPGGGGRKAPPWPAAGKRATGDEPSPKKR